MATAIAVSVISSTIVLLITVFVKDYISKSKEANVHRHLIESIDRLRENLKEAWEENHKLKNEVDFLRDKIDRLESYIAILKDHISDGNPPPPPENVVEDDEIEQLLSQ